jgi:integrase
LNRLTAARVRAIKEPGRYSDGGNLLLQVDSETSKAWIFRFVRDGKEHMIGLGPLHTVSLAEAREAALGASKLLLKGEDPLEAKRAAARARAPKAIVTFGQCAEWFWQSLEGTWKTDKHRRDWLKAMKRDAAALMPMPVASITTADVHDCLMAIWEDKPDAARRLRRQIERVLDFAYVRGSTSGENAARLKGNLKGVLPKKKKGDNHYAALPYAELPAFMAQLRAMDSIVARALEFTILSAARTSEAAFARWDEIDLDAGTWTIPAERMKADREHRVPLSDHAVRLLQHLPRKSAFILPGRRASKSINDDAMLVLIKTLNPDITVHGMRSTFRDWVAERTSYPAEIAEQALAHAHGSGTERAYRRGDVFEKRRKLMQAWADYCQSTPASGKVLPLRAS